MGGRVPRHATGIALAGIALGAGLVLAMAGRLEPRRPIEFCSLILAAILISVLGERAIAQDGAARAAAFIVNFTSLLFFGPVPTSLVVVAGIAPRRQAAADAAALTAALAAAAAAHSLVVGAFGDAAWPWQGLPIAAAVLAYCFAEVVFARVVAPLARRQPIDRAWRKHFLAECPIHFVSAGVAAGLVEAIDRRIWELLPVAALPLYFAGRAYNDYVLRLESERRRLEVIDALAQGMAVVDRSGRVTLWNDVLERMMTCARDRAIGRSLAAAVPALASTELPRAVADALTAGTSRTLPHFGLCLAQGVRILQVRILVVDGGATLLWDDVTERAEMEQALRRSDERLALAAEGATDGLWEWDLRTQEFYFSARLNAMLGLPARTSTGRPEQWIARIHPEDVPSLKDALQAHLAGTTDYFQHEHRLRLEDGSYRRFVCRGLAVLGANRRPARIAGSFTDTTDRAIDQERLRSAGFLDPLTGLRNRADFVEGVGRRLAEFKQKRGSGRFAVLYLDLDRFKVVNDSLGHLVGDELLIAVSRRLESCLRQGDSLARLGGDEFAVLLNTVGDEQQANAIALRIQDALSEPLLVGGREVFTSASIGIAFGTAQYATPDEIMRDADTAMYHAKAHGKARHELFDADMHARVRDRLGLENDLRHAVNSKAFEVHYQPIVSLASGMCVGFESLVRWTRNGEPVSPATFVPMAEELGLVEPLGTWVLREACRTFAEWKRRFPEAGLEFITVNASSRQLMQHNFLLIVEQAVHEAHLTPSDLRIEVTETALMDSPHVAAEVLGQLRDFGVKIYLDDFGTGYSSLSHLHKLPVDTLKIDRSFVRSLLLPDRPAIVESILALARTLNTSVVAEGIETEVQARELERLGCTHAQGFLFSRPLSTRAVEDLLATNQPLGPKQAPATEAAADPEMYYSSAPFEWPEHIAVGRPGADESRPTLVGPS